MEKWVKKRKASVIDGSMRIQEQPTNFLFHPPAQVPQYTRKQFEHLYRNNYLKNKQISSEGFNVGLPSPIPVSSPFPLRSYPRTNPHSRDNPLLHRKNLPDKTHLLQPSFAFANPFPRPPRESRSFISSLRNRPPSRTLKTNTKPRLSSASSEGRFGRNQQEMMKIL